MHNIARQIQAIIATLKDAKFTNKDIYLTYIDFKIRFDFIDHPGLLAVMEDLGYPPNAIKLIGNIYAKLSTSFARAHFTTTLPIQISCAITQGDTLCPYLFIIFLERLLRQRKKDQLGYHFNATSNNIIATAYANYLVILTYIIQHIQAQLDKLR